MARYASGLLRTSLRSNLFNARQNPIRTVTTTGSVGRIFKVQDEDDFERNVVKSPVPVVIDFQASWCGPCKILEPRLEMIIAKKKSAVHLAKVDIDDNSELAMKYEVLAVPFVLGFKDGKPAKSFTGLVDEDVIESFVNELVGS